MQKPQGGEALLTVQWIHFVMLHRAINKIHFHGFVFVGLFIVQRLLQITQKVFTQTLLAQTALCVISLDDRNFYLVFLNEFPKRSFFCCIGVIAHRFPCFDC